MLINFFLIILGGGLGSASRYFFSIFAGKCFGNDFAWGTLGVNLLGCLFIGVAFAFVERNISSTSVRLFFITGFLGGLTTFSTYMLDSVNFLKSGATAMMVANILANNIGGLALVFLGFKLGRLLF